MAGPRLPRATSVVREIAFFAFFLFLAVALTWPLARHLGTAVTDLEDPLLNTWILDWVLHALTHDPLRLYDAPMFAGARYPIAFSENLIGIAILVLPFELAGLTPIEVHNVAILLGMALSGYAATVLARTARASMFASILAGVSFAFGPFFLYHLPHLQVVSAGWIPLMLAALLRLLRLPTWPNASLFAAAFVMAGLTNIHWLLFGGFAAAAVALLVFAVDPAHRNRTTVVRVVIAFAAAGLVLLPFLIPYRVVAEEYGMKRSWEDIDYHSAHLVDYFRAMSRSALHGSLGMTKEPERNLHNGLFPLALAFAAIVLARRRDTPAAPRPPSERRWLLRALDVTAALFAVLTYLGTASGSDGFRIGSVVLVRNGSTPLMGMLLAIAARWWLRLPDVLTDGNERRLGDVIHRSRYWPEVWIALLLVCIGVAGSLGTHSILHPFLFHNVEPFRATRVPARWAVIAYAGLIVLAARGADEIARRAGGWKRLSAAALMIVVALADTAPRIQWTHVVTDRVPVYDWLERERVSGPIFELPMTGHGIPWSYLLGLAHHRVPLINGTSGFAPPWDGQLQYLSGHDRFDDEFSGILRRLGTQLVIVHADLLRRQQRPVVAWIEREMRAGNLVLIRRFDRGPNGDYVFAMTSSRGWERLGRSGVRDAAGFTAEDAWRRFASGLTVYSDLPLLSVDAPKPWDEVHRTLTISGWALSPHGIRDVEVLLDGRRLLVRAQREARTDVKAAYPWYPNDPLPGFRAVIAKRPKGVRKNTDLQVRVTDRAGRIVHSEQRFIRWH